MIAGYSAAGGTESFVAQGIGCSVAGGTEGFMAGGAESFGGASLVDSAYCHPNNNTTIL